MVKSVLLTLKIQYTKKKLGKQGGKRALGSGLWALGGKSGHQPSGYRLQEILYEDSGLMLDSGSSPE